jgi:hypothetical protein
VGAIPLSPEDGDLRPAEGFVRLGIRSDTTFLCAMDLPLAFEPERVIRNRHRGRLADRRGITPQGEPSRLALRVKRKPDSSARKKNRLTGLGCGQSSVFGRSSGTDPPGSAIASTATARTVDSFWRYALTLCLFSLEFSLW